MVTEQDLRAVLAAAVDDPAAEGYTLGLSDRALMAAEGREARKWVRYVPGVAVGTAFVVAGTFGVLALDGAGGGSGGRRVTVSDVPAMSANPVAPSMLLDFEVECSDKHAPKMAMDWVWDPDSQQYHAVDSNVYTAFKPSPDGKRALVVQGVDKQLWGVADYADAVAGRMTYHRKGDGSGLRWTADGKEVTSTLEWIPGPGKDSPITIANKTADFYDPTTGAKSSVPFPQTVIDDVAGGQWRLQQWQGDHDSVLFPMASVSGGHLKWLDAQGKEVRTLTLENGLPAGGMNDGTLYLGVWFSPDGRYVVESDSWSLVTFDLQDGRRLGQMRTDANSYVFRNDSSPWTGDHDIILTSDPAMTGVGKPGWKDPKTGHSPIYHLLGPDLKQIEETKFVLPDDPKGYCSSWPITWAPKTQFPGAFVP